MTENLSFAIWTLQCDAKNMREALDRITDQQVKDMTLERSLQCEKAAKILEQYAEGHK